MHEGFPKNAVAKAMCEADQVFSGLVDQMAETELVQGLDTDQREQMLSYMIGFYMRGYASNAEIMKENFVCVPRENRTTTTVKIEKTERITDVFQDGSPYYGRRGRRY